MHSVSCLNSIYVMSCFVSCRKFLVILVGLCFTAVACIQFVLLIHVNLEYISFLNFTHHAIFIIAIPKLGLK